jgi:hypothetical protein
MLVKLITRRRLKIMIYNQASRADDVKTAVLRKDRANLELILGRCPPVPLAPNSKLDIKTF